MTEPLDALRRDAELHYAAGRMEQSLACYEAALALAPDSPSLPYNMANVLRIVERELLDNAATLVRESLDGLGFADETALAQAIRDGQLDDRPDEVMECLRSVVRHRLSIDHPGYDDGR